MENYSENSLESILARRMSFGTRFGAWIVDAILIIVLSVALGSTIGAMFGLTLGNEATKGMTKENAELAITAVSGLGLIMGAMAGFMGMTLAIPLFSTLFSLLEAFTGRTPAKLLFGLVVANQDGTKGDISMLGLRAAIKIIPHILIFASITTKIEALNTIGVAISLLIFIGSFFVLSEKKQAFHDLIAKTAVFRASEIEKN